MMMVLLVAGCHDEDAVKTLVDSSKSTPRIASFSPALTATVVALGWEQSLVGRTPWCASTAPIVGSLNDVDLETLARANPTLILIQQTQTGAPPQLEQVANAKHWNLEFIPATSLDDIRHLPGAVEKAFGQPAPIRAQLLVDALEKELTPCAAAQKLSPAILLYSDEPIGAFGADTYLAQAWVAMGGTLALPNKGNPNLSMEELFATQPKSIIVIVGAAGDKDHARSAGVLPDVCSKRGVLHLALCAPKLLLPGPEFTTGLKLFRGEIEKFCQPMTPMSSPNISTEQMNGAADKP